MVKKTFIAVIAVMTLSVDAVAQLPVATAADDFKVDAVKEDVAKPGFKVQFQMEVQTGPWIDIPASLVKQSVLPDTETGKVTLVIPMNSGTVPGNHVIYVRACATSIDPAATLPACSAAIAFAFTFKALDDVRPLSNPRLGPRGGVE